MKPEFLAYLQDVTIKSFLIFIFIYLIVAINAAYIYSLGLGAA